MSRASVRATNCEVLWCKLQRNALSLVARARFTLVQNHFKWIHFSVGGPSSTYAYGMSLHVERRKRIKKQKKQKGKRNGINATTASLHLIVVPWQLRFFFCKCRKYIYNKRYSWAASLPTILFQLCVHPPTTTTMTLLLFMLSQLKYTNSVYVAVKV